MLHSNPLFRLAFWIGLLPMHGFFTHVLVTWKLLVSWVLHIFQMLKFYYTISKNPYLSILLSISSEKFCKYWEGIKITVAGRRFKNSNFCFKTNFKICFYHWQQILSVFFSKWHTNYSFFQKMSHNRYIWITALGLLVFFHINRVFHGKSGWVSL